MNREATFRLSRCRLSRLLFLQVDLCRLRLLLLLLCCVTVPLLRRQSVSVDWHASGLFRLVTNRAELIDAEMDLSALKLVCSR
jgi:hypothetical protein